MTEDEWIDLCFKLEAAIRQLDWDLAMWDFELTAGVL